jgi:hypothetical protein
MWTSRKTYLTLGQTIIAQKDWAHSIHGLAEIMADTYAFVDPLKKIDSQSQLCYAWCNRHWSAAILSVITPKMRTSVCWFPIGQVTVTVVDRYSGKRIVKNLVSDVDNKVKQFQDMFSNLQSELRQQAGIYTKITVLRVLDVVGEIGEFLIWLICGLSPG